MALQNLNGSDLLLVNRDTQSYKITIDDFSSELGLDLVTGDLVVDNDLIVNGDVILGNPGLRCLKTLDIYNDTHIFCELTVDKPSIFQETIEVKGIGTFKENVDIKGEVYAGKNAFVTEGVKATTTVVSQTIAMSGDGAGDDSVSPGSYAGKPPKFRSTQTDLNTVEIQGGAGDAYFKGEVHAAFFEGDGSRLVNLNLPGSLNFKGIINAVTDDAPNSVLFGDYYLNSDPTPGEADGTPKSDGNWVNLTDPVAEGDFIYYAEISDNTGGWVKASGDDTAYVTLAGAQTIDGAKKFSQVIVAESGVDASGSLVNTNDLRFVNGAGSTLDLSFKATSMSTTGLDGDNTLVTKDYVDYFAVNSHTEFDLVAGDHLIDASGAFDARFDGSAEVTLNVDADTADTPNKIVLRDGTGSIVAVDVNSNGNVNVSSGNVLVGGGLSGKGKITATGDITTTQTAVSDKVVTNEVQAETYNIQNLTSIGAAPTTP